MSLGRRKVSIDEPSRWVFNRIADVYDARPAYPAALVETLVEMAGRAGRDGKRQRVLDIGAGTGHLSLPLAERGLAVAAVEPARSMLDRLGAAAAAHGVEVCVLHAQAERLPLPDASVDLAIVADALHFLDAELTGLELQRVLTKRGGLAVVTCEWGDTPFMRQLVGLIETAVPRRPRSLQRQLRHISALTDIPFLEVATFRDETPVDHATLDRILRSVSFIGPAMNVDRASRFRTAVRSLTAQPVWARTFKLRFGQRTVHAKQLATSASTEVEPRW